MGTKRLKVKDDLHYRPGGTAHHCSACNYYFGEFLVLHRGDIEPRCKIIGLGQGLGYRINPKFICDEYDNSRQLKRLRGY